MLTDLLLVSLSYLSEMVGILMLVLGGFEMI